jgi:hypothetical protein
MRNNTKGIQKHRIHKIENKKQNKKRILKGTLDEK